MIIFKKSMEIQFNLVYNRKIQSFHKHSFSNYNQAVTAIITSYFVYLRRYKYIGEKMATTEYETEIHL